MHNSNSEGPVISSHIFGTQDGMIGTVSQLEPEEWKFLHGVQQAMTEVVKGIGGLKHSDWRSFHDHRCKKLTSSTTAPSILPREITLS